MAFFNHAYRGPRIYQAALLAFGLVACTANAQSLPSGLTPLTQLSVGGAQVALDSNGSLFRSDDGGKHWKGVKQQWDGKAVELVGIPALTEAPGSGQASKPEDAQERYAAVLLRSTTALHWVSVDRGKTWKPSTLDDIRRNDIKWSGN